MPLWLLGCGMFMTFMTQIPRPAICFRISITRFDRMLKDLTLVSAILPSLTLALL